MNTPTLYWSNPYAGLPEARIHRTTIEIDKQVWTFLSAIHGRRGTLQNTINILLSKFINELNRIQFHDYDPDTYERLVTGTNLILGGTQPSSRPTSSKGDDGRRATDMVQQHTGADHVLPNPSSPYASKRGKNGGNKRKGYE